MPLNQPLVSFPRRCHRHAHHLWSCRTYTSCREGSSRLATAFSSPHDHHAGLVDRGSVAMLLEMMPSPCRLWCCCHIFWDEVVTSWIAVITTLMEKALLWRQYCDSLAWRWQWQVCLILMTSFDGNCNEDRSEENQRK